MAHALEARRSRGLARKRRSHAIVFDVRAKRVEPDFGGVELDRAGRKKGACIVEDTQGAQWRSIWPDRRPKPEGLEIGDRAVEHSDRASSPDPFVCAA